MEWFNKILGSKIKELRIKAKLSQAQLGQLINLSRASIMNIESGRHCPPLFTIYTLCCIFNCDVSEIIPPIKRIDMDSTDKVIIKKVYKKFMKPVLLNKPPYEINADINKLRRETGCPKEVCKAAVDASQYHEEQIAYIKKNAPKF